jgi:hypothetical protein
MFILNCKDVLSRKKVYQERKGMSLIEDKFGSYNSLGVVSSAQMVLLAGLPQSHR